MGVILDGRTIADREELHSLLAKELAFPAYYGGTLDALFDCLTELCEETEIRVLHAQALEAQLGGYARRLIRVLRAAEAENPRIILTVVPDMEREEEHG